MKVAVIGAGIVGMATAVELASRGAEVTVIDARYPGAGTTSTSYAWINSNNKTPDAYFDLNLAGLEAHRTWAAKGGPWIGGSGHIEFATEPDQAEALEARVKRLSALDYDAQIVSPASARQRSPHLQVPAKSTVAIFAQERYCLPMPFLAHLLQRAASLGVVLHNGVAVVALDESGAGVTMTLGDGRTVLVDRVVSAAGRWTDDVTDIVGLPRYMLTFQSPGDVIVGHLAWTTPVPADLQHLITSPLLNVRPDGGGRLLLQALDLDVCADPQDVPTPDSRLAQQLIARLRSVLAHTEGARVSDLVVGQRAMPADGLSVVGTPAAVPWLYVIATHSGVTLAPFLAQSAARELAGGHEPLLDAFRPDRFLTAPVASSPAPPRRPGDQ